MFFCVQEMKHMTCPAFCKKKQQLAEMEIKTISKRKVKLNILCPGARMTDAYNFSYLHTFIQNADVMFVNQHCKKKAQN